MKYTCPICEESGNISEENLEQPVTPVACRKCGTLLLVDPDTGKVDAYKSPLKDSPTLKTSTNRLVDVSASIFDRRPQGRAARDWTAILVVAIVVLVLISAGAYFAVNSGII